MDAYPEHEKLATVQPQSQACGEFFGLDRDRLEAEKRDMLAAQRAFNSSLEER